MTRRNLITAAVACVVLAAAGCYPNRLNVEKAFTLEVGEMKAFEAPPQTAAQTVKVEITSDNPVDVYVLLNMTADAAAALEHKDVTGKSAASKTGTKGDTLSVPVPAGQGVAVWVGLSGGGKKASGTVKMTN